MLSPLDWAMVESWKERGIPLRIAVRAVETVFDRVDQQPNKARSIKSLSYCRDEVEAQYEEWLAAQVGKTNDTENENANSEKETEDKTVEHLSNLCSKITEAKVTDSVRKILNGVSDKLEDLKTSNFDSESIEKSLGGLETKIDNALLENTDKNLLAKIEDEIEKDLASYKSKMEDEVYTRTFELMLLKKLREEANVPRLSLFSL